ncbi:MAG: hypothetical protein JSV43_02230 [Methanobacteriota archaeon]|nr:MAG: hypothetical protein JSV43_02230 [Euryarchaeota archaeon]
MTIEGPVIREEVREDMTTPEQVPEQQPVPEPQAAPEPQPVYAQPAAPVYAQPQPLKLENAGVGLLVTGAILIGIGIMILGIAPGDISVDPSGMMTGYNFGVQMTTLLIACILIGIGTILEGLGVGITIKAHFTQQEKTVRT